MTVEIFVLGSIITIFVILGLFFKAGNSLFSHIFPGRRFLPITPVTVPEAHVPYSDEISSHALMLAWLILIPRRHDNFSIKL